MCQSICRYLELNRPPLRSLSIVLEHCFLQDFLITTIRQSDFKILEKYCLSDNLIILLGFLFFISFGLFITTIKQSDFKILEKYCLSDNLIILLGFLFFISFGLFDDDYQAIRFQDFRKVLSK